MRSSMPVALNRRSCGYRLSGVERELRYPYCSWHSTAEVTIKSNNAEHESTLRLNTSWLSIVRMVRSRLMMTNKRQQALLVDAGSGQSFSPKPHLH
jgi:hypothetical protein